MSRPFFSIVIPIHATMKNGDYFLWRSIQSLMSQTFKDFEIVIVQEGSMPVNTNAGIEKARGEFIKILYLDDYLAHNRALEEIAKSLHNDDEWLVTGCLHQKSNGPDFWEDPHTYHKPEIKGIYSGINTVGSPSVLTLKNKDPLMFDIHMSWLLDLDMYVRLHKKYGEPKVLNTPNVVIGLHDGQMSHILTEEEKESEWVYFNEKNNSHTR